MSLAVHDVLAPADLRVDFASAVPAAPAAPVAGRASVGVVFAPAPVRRRGRAKVGVRPFAVCWQCVLTWNAANSYCWQSVRAAAARTQAAAGAAKVACAAVAAGKTKTAGPVKHTWAAGAQGDREEQ